ncbi:hypothetical protein Y1Q_0011485 [Alligator mississippiensis]|uniref:Uncharacterized protein n=1 Tax=Alligator mississippiensis TaxID=8496 RepID=A0A151LZZ8_ALLMI|nr:hypothetical protein Y1Q_0011485 [Alligator mississippiensis]
MGFILFYRWETKAARSHKGSLWHNCEWHLDPLNPVCHSRELRNYRKTEGFAGDRAQESLPNRDLSARLYKYWFHPQQLEMDPKG